MVILGHSPWSGIAYGRAQGVPPCHREVARSHGGVELPQQPCRESWSASPTTPGVRLPDIASMLGISERSAFGIVADLTTASYVVKDKDGRRNR